MKFSKISFRLLVNMIVKLLFFVSIIKISSIFKINFILGSYRALFSGSSAAVPLAGLFGGGFLSFVIFVFAILFRYLIFGISSLHILAFYVPGLFASLYMSSENIVIRLFLPALCMILFILNPIGLQAFAYSFYWLIPIVIYFIKTKNIFLHALGSTFVAHAVGSVIWIYTVGMSAEVWNSLIPIVFLERLAIASAIVAFYKLFNLLGNKLKKRSPVSLVVFPVINFAGTRRV